MENAPKILKIIFQTLGVIFFIIAVFSLFSFGAQFYLYSKTNIWKPLMTFSFAGFGFIGSYAFWKYQKWAVVIFSVNFINILLIQALNFTTLNRAALPVLLSGGILLLVYFSRHYLNGAYLKWLPVLLFVVFTLLNQISLRYLLGVW